MADEPVIRARVPEEQQEENIFKKQDPFNKKWDDLKVFRGLDKNFKRRTDRIVKADLMSPAYQDSAKTTKTGRDGTGFYFHNPYAPNGYNLNS
jgi:hypothetical protein